MDWQQSLNWYISQFPEAQFLVSEKYKREYNKKTILGHSIARQSDVLICGIMRNVGSVMPYTIARIEALGNLFNSYHIFIYENDSTDNTRDDLLEWSRANYHISVQNEDVNPPPFTNQKGVQRRRWMAYARNKYLEFAREYARKNYIHYLIVVDTDLQGGWSYHGVLNSLGQSGWDVIGSNSLYYYEEQQTLVRLFYDAWAFRYDGQPEEVEDTTINVLQFHRGEPLVKVNSCFGGLAIYKPYTLFTGLNYTEEDCDHPTLHNALCKMDYKIYLNPSQITLYNKTEYTV